MKARALFFAGLFATAAIAFSGVLADTTGVEIAEPAVAAPNGPHCITVEPWYQLCQGNVDEFLCWFVYDPSCT